MKKKNKTHYYVNSSYGGLWIIYLLSIFFGIKFKKLEFNLRDIRDHLGELIRVKIPRKVLFEIKENIIQSKEYTSFTNSNWEEGRISDYIEKSILEGYLNSKNNNYPKILYLINVVSLHNNKSTNKSCVLVLYKLPWYSILMEYAQSHQVELKFVRSLELIHYNFKNTLIDLLKRNSQLFIFIKSLVKYKINLKTTKTNVAKLYLEGRGNVNFGEDGYKSDFFFVNNSQILPATIAYRYESKDEKKLLDYNGIYSVNGLTRFYQNKSLSIPYISPIKKYSNTLEHKKLRMIINKYKYDKSYWYSFFKHHKIKIHLTWYDNNAEHMVIADAIKEIGGIAAMGQTSFYGYKSYECRTNTDVMFFFSKYSLDLNQSLGSKNKYNIITGLLSDYSPSLLVEQAQKIRNKLKLVGVKKIVTVLDENSSDDPRWHTGHELQRENYSHILNKVLEVPWLGVVFKPKKANTLRRRLGPVNELLLAAEKTGRCIILESSGKHQSNVPPLLAGLAADVVIHGHLHAGTAALECALQGKPTLLVDRENASFSKLNELPKGSVVFNNWQDTIDAVYEHFQSQKGIPYFGDWSTIINELDPFRDGLAENRKGMYLYWLLDGFSLGLKREEILAEATDKYARKWGYDKIV